MFKIRVVIIKLSMRKNNKKCKYNNHPMIIKYNNYN